MSFLIESRSTVDEATGQLERKHVRDLDGYPAEEWKVIGEGRTAKPREHCEFVDGKWVRDDRQKDDAERRAALRSMPRDDLVEALMDEIEDLRSRVITLEQFIASSA